jgi:predicted nucleic acid-binding protein
VGYLLDTNHLGAAIRRQFKLRDRLMAAHHAGVRIGTIVPVLCEVDAGLAQVVDAERCYLAMRRLLSFVRIWTLEPKLARTFGDIYFDLRKRGRSISHVDLLLSAMARQMGHTILTTDRDFEALPDLRTENWVSP